MIVCGVHVSYDTTGIVTLEPFDGAIAQAHTFHGRFDLERIASFLAELAHQHHPQQLWIAISDWSTYVMDQLPTQRFRWVYYPVSAVGRYFPDEDELPPEAEPHAVALARALQADLDDVRRFHEEMLYLSFLRDAVTRGVLPMSLVGHHELRIARSRSPPSRQSHGQIIFTARGVKCSRLYLA